MQCFDVVDVFEEPLDKYTRASVRYTTTVNPSNTYYFALRMTRTSSRNVGKLYTEH